MWGKHSLCALGLFLAMSPKVVAQAENACGFEVFKTYAQNSDSRIWSCRDFEALVNYNLSYGRTAFLLAFSNRHKSPEALAYLERWIEEPRANWNISDANGQAPVTYFFKTYRVNEAELAQKVLNKTKNFLDIVTLFDVLAKHRLAKAAEEDFNLRKEIVNMVWNHLVNVEFMTPHFTDRLMIFGAIFNYWIEADWRLGYQNTKYTLEVALENFQFLYSEIQVEEKERLVERLFLKARNMTMKSEKDYEHLLLRHPFVDKPFPFNGDVVEKVDFVRTRVESAVRRDHVEDLQFLVKERQMSMHPSETFKFSLLEMIQSYEADFCLKWFEDNKK